MIKFYIEVSPEVESDLRDAARIKGMKVEDYIAYLVNRYAVQLHTLEVESMEKGYEECGSLNLEWANLK